MKCMGSFALNCMDEYDVFLLDDGTCNPAILAEYAKLFKSPAVCYTNNQQEELVYSILKRFPNCLEFWGKHILARKLLVPALVGGEDIVFIDADIFFITKFSLKNAIQAVGNGYAFMFDTSDYARTLIWPHTWIFRFFWPQLKFVRRANTGIIIFKKTSWNAQFIEHILGRRYYKWHCKKLIGSIFYWMCEQTLYAMLAARGRAYYINPKQCRLANEGFTSDTTLNYTALHFVTGTRNLISKCAEISAKNENREHVVNIELIDAQLQPIAAPAWEEIKLGIRQLIRS
jgi:hypothetical protein